MQEDEKHFKFESACLSVCARDEFLHRSLDVNSSLRKMSALCISQVAKAFDLGSSSSRSPSVRRMKAKKPCEALSSKGTKKPAEGLMSDKDDIDFGLVHVDVLYVSFDK